MSKKVAKKPDFGLPLPLPLLMLLAVTLVVAVVAPAAALLGLPSVGTEESSASSAATEVVPRPSFEQTASAVGAAIEDTESSASDERSLEEQLLGSGFNRDAGNSTLFYREVGNDIEVHVFLRNGEIDRVYLRGGPGTLGTCEHSESFNLEDVEAAAAVLVEAWPDATPDETSNFSCTIS